MGYSDQISILKKSLEGFGSEEKKLSDLYKTAISNAEKSTQQAIEQLQEDYYENRNRVYSDVARSERNLNNQLAARGLGFSGEAAQAKLNSNVALYSALGQLTRDKNAAEQKYNLELANRISDLSMEEAEKLKDLIDSRNQLNLQIASLELDKENADADRKAEKENLLTKLEAEKKNLNAQIYADWKNLLAKLNADKAINDANIKADKDKQKTQIAADWRSLLTNLIAEKAINNANIKADKDKQKTQINADWRTLLAKLNAEKDINNANIQADKDKQKAQIDADLESLLTKLAAEKEINDANIQADKDKQKAQIDADKETLNTKLNHETALERKRLLYAMSELNAKLELEKEKLETDKAMNDAKLKAEQEALITKLEAEKDMLEAEILAKYYGNSYGSGSGSSSSGSGSSSSGSGSSSSGESTGNGLGYIPDLSPKELAKQITGGKHLDGENAEYAVEKFLLDLKTDYNINSDYYEELVLMLASYGYSKIPESEMRTNVITYEAKAYDSIGEYNRYYNYYVSSGYTPYVAKTMARKDIKSKQMQFIHDNCKNNTEFKTCCAALGINQSVYNEFLKNLSEYGKVEKYN